MAGKNEVTLTFAGDSDQLTRAFRDVGSAADQMQAGVSQASDRMASDTAAATDRMSQEARQAADSFDRVGGSIDTTGGKAGDLESGFRGITDSMSGFSQIARGDVVGGLTDMAGGAEALAMGFSGVLVPALKSARTGMQRAAAATKAYLSTARGATVALGAVGIALGVVTAALLIFRQQQDEVEVSTENLVEDLERFERTGRITGEITKILGDDASELKGRLQALDPALRENRSLWDSIIDVGRVARAEMDLLKEELADLDTGLAAFVRAGGDGEAVLEDLADAYGLNERELGHIIEALPRYRQELQRAKEEEIDAQLAVTDHIESLKELADTLQAQTDPIFAWVQAQQQAEAAQRAVNEALDEFGRGSPQHERALLDLAAAELGLVGATGDVAGAFDESLLPTLEQLRDDGHLSEQAFRAITEAMEQAKEEARRLDGTRTRINVDYVVTTSRGRGGSPGAPRLPFHIGTHVVPGPIGMEVPAILQAGERVVPRGGSGGGVVKNVFVSDGTRVGDLLVELFMESMRTNEPFRAELTQAVTSG